MDRSSKRDIYDLIAELAKSVNMDIEGTEFEKSSTQEEASNIFSVNLKSEKEVEITAEPYPQKNFISDSLHADIDSKAENSDNQQNPTNEFQDFKTSLLEELKSSRDEMMKELEQVKSLTKELIKPENKEPEPVNDVTENVQTAETIIEKEENTPVISNATKHQHHPIENAPKRSSLLEELERLRGLEQQQKEQALRQSNEQHMFESLSVDDLNKITTEAALSSKKELEADEAHNKELNVHDSADKNTSYQNSLIIDQLKQINDKMEIFNERNLKTEIVNQLKLSDAHIVQQVHQSRETILNDLSFKVAHSKSEIDNRFLKWLAIINLILLILLLIYFLFQRDSRRITSVNMQDPLKISKPTNVSGVKPENSKQPDTVNSIPLKANSLATNTTTEQPIEETTYRKPATKRINTNIRNWKDKRYSYQKYRKEKNATDRTINSSASIGSSNIQEVSNAENKKPQPINKAKGKPTVKVPASPKTQNEITKKNIPKEDVYFGED